MNSTGEVLSHEWALICDAGSERKVKISALLLCSGKGAAMSTFRTEAGKLDVLVRWVGKKHTEFETKPIKYYFGKILTHDIKFSLRGTLAC